MKKKILKVSIVCLLLVTLTAINFISVGANLVSYALDGTIEAKTNHNNVGFSAYLKNEQGEKLTNANVDINSKEMKLYLKVEVRREGYFNGEIKLTNANFEFVSSESEFVNKVTSDTISLNQINVGSDPEIEVVIKPNITDKFDLNLLNMESEMSLTGIYRDSAEKDKEVKGTKKVQVSYISTAKEADVVNQLDVITNKIGMYNGEEKRIIQLSLKLGVKDNSYPIKNITSQISVPVINDEDPVIEGKLNETNISEWNYKYENGMVTANLENKKDNRNNILWTKQGYEEIILSYIYSKDVEIDNSSITSNEVLTLYDGKELKAEDAIVGVKVDDEKDGIVILKEEVQQPLYKGKVYAGVDKEYKTKTQVQVNLNKAVENIYVNEVATSLHSCYNKTEINKNQLVSVIGQEGKLEITTKKSNGTETIATVSATNDSDDNGNIVINYPEGVENITIRITKPHSNNNLVLNHTKSLKADNKTSIKKATEMRTAVKGTYDVDSKSKGNISEVVATTELKETVTDAKIEINRESLSTVTENKGVEIKATLKSNSEQNDLYTNPTIEIELPADVIAAKVNSINKIYGDEFTTVRPTQTVVNGKQVIRVELDGTQTAYKEPGVDGTEIIINADLTLNNKATSKEDAIKMTYTNANVNQYKDGANVGTEAAKIQVVSPKGLITVNNMEALDVETIGEQENVSKVLEKASGAKQVKVETEVINNNESEINDIAILGKFGTDGTDDNLKAALKSGVSVEGENASNVKVYYTENKEATADVENAENEWKENATSETDTAKYLVLISNMKVSEGLKLSYDLEIPANLEYNQKANQGYEVKYVESKTGTEQHISSTQVELTTGTGPVVEAKLTAQLGSRELTGNEEVKQGEIIKYTTEVTNNGTKDAQEVKVVGEVPEGVTVINNSNEQVLNNLKVGETRTIEYEAQVNKDAKINQEISTKSVVLYEDVSKQSNEISNKIAEGSVGIYVEPDEMNYGNGEVVVNDTTQYLATVTNLTGSELKNVKFTWDLPEELQIISQYVVDAEKYNLAMKDPSKYNDEDYTDLNNDKEITIDSIPVDKAVIVHIMVKSNTIKEDSKKFVITAKADVENKTYSSNEAEGKIKNNTKFSVDLKANKENEYVKVGDEIEYTINVKNENGMDVPGLLIEDTISKGLSIKEITVGNEKVEIPVDNKVSIPLDMASNEQKDIKIKTVVNYVEDMKDDEEVADKVVLYTSGGEKTSNEVSHTIVSPQNDEDNYVTPEGTVIHTYKINGKAWEDENKDGQRQDEEKQLEGIEVTLLNVATNELAKSPDGEEIKTTTAADGSYTLSKIPSGDYVVLFSYDTSTYRLTDYQKVGVDANRSSDVVARKLAINGGERTYGVTDTIKITENSVSNVNIGLAISEKFDMKLEKFVNKVIIQSAAGTQTYDYNDETLAKIELAAKNVQDANAIIEYKIRVTNVGELEGYVKNIVDYLPSDLTFASELNKDWYIEGNNVRNNSLANQRLAVGESKELTLTVSKKMTEENTGLINNLAEISEDYNGSGMTDINSTPGNKTQGENDMGSADVIISIKTGGPVLYTSLVVVVMIVLAVGIFFIKKEVTLKDIM